MTLSEFIALLASVGAASGLITYLFQRKMNENLSAVSIIKTRKEIEQLEQEIESKYAQQVKIWLDDLHLVKEKHDKELEKKNEIILTLQDARLLAIEEIASLRLKVGQCGRAHRRLFVEMGIPYWECAKDGTLIYANGAWLHLFGLSTEEAMGEGWLKSVPPDDRKRLLVDWYSKVIDESDGQLVFQVTNPITKEIKSVKAIYAVKFDSDGDVYKIIGTTTEIVD